MSMKKKIIICVILIAFAGVSLYLARDWEKNDTGQNVQSNKQNTAQTQNVWRKLVLSYIPEIKQKETFRLSPTDNRTFTALAYPNQYTENLNFVAPGGIMVVDITDRSKPTVFWEIQSPSFVDEGQNVEVRDITGDGRPELLSKWGVGVRLQGNLLWIFSYDGTTFKSINPIIQGTTSNGIIHTVDVMPTDFTNKPWYKSAFWGATVDAIDLDHDNISEINVLTISDASDTDNSQNEKTDTYKWNGAKYYLWKTVTEKKVY